MLGKTDNIIKIQNNTIRHKTSLQHRNQCYIIIYQHTILVNEKNELNIPKRIST